MKVIRSHKIRMFPSSSQETFLKQCCGVKRVAYNWGLEVRQRSYKEGSKLSVFQLKKLFNSVKPKNFPYMYDVPVCVPNNAILDLDKAYTNFFRELKKGHAGCYPVFKKKGVHDSFRINNDRFNITVRYIKIQKLETKLKLAETLRFQGKIISATVSSKADQWFVSVAVEFECNCSKNQAACGIDLGITNLITLSDGTKYANPNRWIADDKKLAKLRRSLSRKQFQSNNYRKARVKLAKFYLHLSDRNTDYINKITTEIANNYGNIWMENLSVTQMLQTKQLAAKLSKSLFNEIKRKLAYKTTVHVIDRYFPSTQICPICGKKNKLTLANRVYACSCGYGPIDRDVHAAQNILRVGCPEVKPVETVSDSKYAATVTEAGSTTEPSKVLLVQDVDTNVHTRKIR